MSCAAEREGARLILANDPDADRLAVAERDEASPRAAAATPRLAAGWRTFTGNECGVLLAHWILSEDAKVCTGCAQAAWSPPLPPVRCGCGAHVNHATLRSELPRVEASVMRDRELPEG